MKHHKLYNETRYEKNRQRIGRGPGSGRGKTSCRGQKGQGARSGARRRYGYEGGQFRLYMKLPTRGFTRGRFAKEEKHFNLQLLEKYFDNDEAINKDTLVEKGLLSKTFNGTYKILAKGSLSKNLKSIEAHRFSARAKQLLEEMKIVVKEL